MSIAIPASSAPSESEALRLELRAAVSQAAKELETLGLDRTRIAKILDPAKQLESDPEFWRAQSRSLVILASSDRFRTFRLANRLGQHVAVGDRFDVGALLRATTFPNCGFVLGLSRGEVTLFEVLADAKPRQLPIEGLPDDLATVLEHTTTGGRFDRQRAQGTTGDRIGHERFARIVQEQVIPILRDSGAPLILAATGDFDTAYRAVNEYPGLLEQRIGAHPGSLAPGELDAKARGILDDHYRGEINDWREEFGTKRSNGHATTSINEVAKAASQGAVAELYFDMDSTLEGELDEDGKLTRAETPGPHTYAIVDEIAARALKHGAKVRAVRRGDLVDGAEVAATLRYPLNATA
ncbi:hypothetical protein C5E07_08430 [Pseudoclavibacter sp. RFBJ3]|uniref:baeRF11 domain-containing protein n=1 Tax=unclassified Pseudoclavibacter TaxID=2615177 RepID=UPI000CE8BDEF|nr:MULTISPECIES: hypothetical protein [unclassified Pseudoclavibacter]MBF4548898.1 hypothetical protein [Pseudoclavibacter sp. VKM Ac-2888]PPF84285.1 hypothetical protein C5C12_07535 [Pseudoclavibacter sp. RFBJ5]PPF92815.1 hypothetical protein C5E07_08430 [Pseudoclavibacter sp. RFBJ3]PPF98113.1 hypothetical protein C5C19_09810 [Pseudoclavibacter sp. RFBH5]PPG02432.1 hypothetical protein C5E06_08110 [Pseudoclavibacter sp. RFBI5]